MNRGQRDRRRRDEARRDRLELREHARFIDALRQIQLLAAGIMLVGVTVSTLVCAGEFNMPWLIAAGAALFLLGLGLFGAARPLARWRSARRK